MKNIVEYLSVDESRKNIEVKDFDFLDDLLFLIKSSASSHTIPASKKKEFERGIQKVKDLVASVKEAGIFCGFDGYCLSEIIATFREMVY